MFDPSRPDYSNTPVSPQRPLYSYGPAPANSMPLVSIVTPFHNTGTLFHEIAASVFRQSFQEWEWIIIEDGSGGATDLEILRNYADRDVRIRIVRSAQDVAAEARSSYLAFLDTEAIYEPTALEKWLWYLKSRPQCPAVRSFQVTFGAKQQFSRDSAGCMIRRDAYVAAGGRERLPGGVIPEYLEWRRSDHKPTPEFDPMAAVESPVRSRLLILVPHLAMGGADKFVLDLMRELISRHAFAVTVAATGRGPHPWRSQFESLTPDVFTTDTFLLFKDISRFLSHLIHTRRINFVLITHSGLGYRLLPKLRDENPGVHFYDYVHMEDPDWKSGGYPAMSLACQPFLDDTAASSQHLKDWMVARGADAQSVSVVTTNVDTDAWRRDAYDAESIRLKWNLRSGVPVILFAGRLSAQKQPDVLAKTLEILQKHGIPYCCLIAGDGELESWLAEFLHKKSIHGTRLIGPHSNETIRELLAISDILFLPSRHEGIALAIYEAMAMGVVPVSADVGGQAELVTPECGVLVAPGPGEPERYAQALERLLGDSTLRAQMAAAAKSRVEKHFRLDQMGNAMAAMLLHQGDISCDTAKDSAAISWPQPPRPRIPIRETLAMLAPLWIGRVHRENRRLLFEILWRSHLRRKLLAAFDASFYCSEYPDVPQLFPFALLHYIFFGYREGRLPSANFDVQDFELRFPEAQKINPLLFLITHDQGYWGG